MRFVDPQRLAKFVAKRPEDGGVVLTGATRWPPADDGRPCPVCGFGIKPGDDGTFCGWCSSASPAREIRLTGERLQAERYLRDEEGASHHQAELARFFVERQGKLSERQRRRIWRGLPNWRDGSAVARPIDHYNPAMLGRKLLRFLKQEPDWSVVLGPDVKPVKARRAVARCV